MWLLGFLYTSSGILIGGTIAWLFSGIQQKADIIYGLCAGIILGLIGFEIFPEAIALGGWFNSCVGFIMGMIVFEILHNKVHYDKDMQNISKKKEYIRTGILLILSFSLHNIPMGIVLGASQKSDFSNAVLQTLLFHSIPEGIILFTPLILADINILLGFLIAFIVSMPVPLGIFAGGFLGVAHQSFNSILIGFTAGILFFVTVAEILYPILIKSSILKAVVCTLIGVGILIFYLKFV